MKLVFISILFFSLNLMAEDLWEADPIGWKMCEIPLNDVGLWPRAPITFYEHLSAYSVALNKPIEVNTDGCKRKLKRSDNIIKNRGESCSLVQEYNEPYPQTLTLFIPEKMEATIKQRGGVTYYYFNEGSDRPKVSLLGAPGQITNLCLRDSSLDFHGREGVLIEYLKNDDYKRYWLVIHAL